MTSTKRRELIEKARNIILTTFAEAEKYGWNHDQLLTELTSGLKRVYAAKGITGAMRDRIYDMQTIMFQAMYRGPKPKIVWLHTCDGLFFENFSKLPKQARESAGQPNQLFESAHYWSDSLKVYSDRAMHEKWEKERAILKSVSEVQSTIQR